MFRPTSKIVSEPSEYIRLSGGGSSLERTRLCLPIPLTGKKTVQFRPLDNSGALLSVFASRFTAIFKNIVVIDQGLNRELSANRFPPLQGAIRVLPGGSPVFSLLKRSQLCTRTTCDANSRAPEFGPPADGRERLLRRSLLRRRNLRVHRGRKSGGKRHARHSVITARHEQFHD